MTIVQYEQTVIPNTEEGRKFAEEYKAKLYGAFRSEEIGTESITIKSEHTWHIKDEVTK
jgi:hypothetical protein